MAAYWLDSFGGAGGGGVHDILVVADSSPASGALRPSRGRRGVSIRSVALTHLTVKNIKCDCHVVTKFLLLSYVVDDDRRAKGGLNPTIIL